MVLISGLFPRLSCGLAVLYQVIHRGMGGGPVVGDVARDGICPLAAEGLDEPFRLAVGLWCVVAGLDVADRQSAAGFVGQAGDGV